MSNTEHNTKAKQCDPYQDGSFVTQTRMDHFNVFFPTVSAYGGQFPATDYSHLATMTEEMPQLTLQASLRDNSSSVMGVGEPSPRRVVPPLARWSWVA